MVCLLIGSLIQSGSVRQPGEWEPQESVWMSYAAYDNKRGLSVHSVQKAVATALENSTQITLLVRPELMDQARREMNLPNITFRPSANNEIWARDFGPTFLVRPDKSLMVATYPFSYWGYSKVTDPIAASEDSVDSKAAMTMNIPAMDAAIVSEGGNRESNGQGTFIMTAFVERQRNPGKTLVEIEAEHKRVLGAKKIIWLEKGLAEDDLTFMGPLPGGVYTGIATGGHVDNVARFVDPHTVLLAEVTEAEAKRNPISATSRARLEKNAAILAKASDQDGTPLKVMRFPVPEPIISKLSPGDAVYDYISGLKYAHPFPKGKPVKVIHAASYLNFLISNHTILTSKFYKSGRSMDLKAKDAETLARLKRLFPKYRVKAIDTDAINLGGGGIHCITQPQPKVN